MVYKKSHRAGRKRRERIQELRKQGILIAPVISNHSLTNYKEAVAELQHLERLHAVEREAQGASYGFWKTETPDEYIDISDKCTSMPINAMTKINLQNGAQGKNSTTCLSTVVSDDTGDFSSNLDFCTALKTEPPDEYIDISDKCTSMPINAAKINLQNGAQGKNSTCLSTVVSNDTGDFSSNLDFVALKTEPPDECIDISDTDDVAIEQQRVNVVADENRNASPSVTNDCIPDRMLQNRGENGYQNCARTDVELMREEINILQEQATLNKQIQERRNEIEEEKLKILRENLALKKAKFEYYKISNLEYKDIFISIDKNLKCLKDKVEKLVPSYLK